MRLKSGAELEFLELARYRTEESSLLSSLDAARNTSAPSISKVGSLYTVNWPTLLSTPIRKKQSEGSILSPLRMVITRYSLPSKHAIVGSGRPNCREASVLALCSSN